MRVLLHNHRRALRIRLLLLFLAVWCVAMCGLAVWLTYNYGLSPADGGELKPLSERLTFAAFVALIGIAPLPPMVLYTRLYLLRVKRTSRQVELTLVGVLRPIQITAPISDVIHANYHEGYFRFMDRVVHTPWIGLRLAGRRLPLIADCQAMQVHRSGLLALAPQRPLRAVRRGKLLSSARTSG